MPTITLFFAATAALLNIWLSIRCGQVRSVAKISHGDGGNMLLQRRMRAQLNFAENTPLVLILFGALELVGAPDMMLAIIAPLYIIARICHALGMDPDTSPLRSIGTMLTMLITIILAGTAIYYGYTLTQAMDMPAEMGTAV